MTRTNIFFSIINIKIINIYINIITSIRLVYTTQKIIKILIISIKIILTRIIYIIFFKIKGTTPLIILINIIKYI